MGGRKIVAPSSISNNNPRNTLLTRNFSVYPVALVIRFSVIRAIRGRNAYIKHQTSNIAALPLRCRSYSALSK
jgi:hypothetical protein